MILELIEPTDKSKASVGQGGIINHIAIEVERINDAINSFKKKGLELESENPYSIPGIFNGIMTVFLKGPSGERIELTEYL